MNYKNNHLHVEDTVMHKGASVTVRSITLIEDTVLDGTPVPAVPWCAKEFFTVTLSNGHWAYGSDIEPINHETTGVTC